MCMCGTRLGDADRGASGIFNRNEIKKETTHEQPI